MASVNLDRVFISLASDPAQMVTGFTNGRTEVFAVPGEVRRMANGRLRTVTRAGSATTVGAMLRLVTPADLTTLRAWAGQTVLFRDVWGRKMYGAYFTVDVEDYRDRSGHDVKIVLAEVSFSEAV